MKISCIIPTCNRPDFLPLALLSVKDQTFEPFEVIIVNNGDNLVDEGEIKKVGDNIKIYNMPTRSGASKARNFGVKKSRGDYFAFLDDDDLWNRDYLKNVSRAFSEGAECVLSRIDHLTAEGEIVPGKNPHGILSIDNLYTFNPGVTGSNLAVSRRVFELVGGFDPVLITSEDKSFIIEILKTGAKVTTLPDNQILWRVHDVERLTDPDKLARGIAAFNHKYRKSMKRWQYLSNLSKVFNNRRLIGYKISGIYFMFLRGLSLFLKKLNI